MEFVGNQINLKSIAVTAAVTFFVGRINLFNGSFPAAIALITVMLAVSTVYIYLVPVLAAAMMTYLPQGELIYGDVIAIILLGMFFLFFHQQKFSINQRTAIAAAVTVLSKCIYYSMQDILFLLQPEELVKEAIAVMIYIRVMNTVARLVYMGTAGTAISAEKAETALTIMGFSLVGAIGMGQIVFPIWMLMIAVILLQKGLQAGFTATVTAAVFWFCQGETQWEIFLLILCGMITGWYLESMVDFKYRKTIVAAVFFLTAGLQGGTQIYGVAAAMTILIAVPQSTLTKVFCVLDSWFMPEFSTDKDLRYLAIRSDLKKKKEAFLRLGELYSADLEGKTIISYQFMGMGRVLDRVLEDLSGRGETAAKQGNLISPMAVAVGQAAYAFDDISGDTMAAFSIHPYEVALMISDGMGKGKKASEESSLVVTTLSKLLQAGFDVDLAMKTVNGILMTGNEEARFATVDLTLIDRKRSRAKIFKMGAATTFIKHDGRVSMLKRQALPAGIIQGLDLEYIDIKLKKGDILIMVSDGVTDCDHKDPNCDWLRERLLQMRTKDPETIAELIVNKAAEKYGIRERDDLSVIVASIGV